MSAFNLLDERWIPVRLRAGQREELGLGAVLRRSREIAVVEDASPFVVAALHRLLLAVLYRALDGPTDIDQARALFRAGLPADRITAYLEKWRERFWLYDERYPFFQVPDYEPKEERGRKQWKPWPVIAAEHNADNAKVLFDHVDNTDAGAIPSAAAARWLIACQTFVLGGGKSEFQYTTGAPSATALMAIPLGVHLEDTLIMSLVPENRDVLAGDQPVWEREPDSLESLRHGQVRDIAGIVDLYTWRSRSIKLRLKDKGENVSELSFASGMGRAPGDVVDPMVGYRVDETRGKLPIQVKDRGLWRDFDSLLPDGSELAPRVVDHAAKLSRNDPARFPRSVLVLGQANNKAKIEYWRHELFALPGALAGNGPVRMEIRELLNEAEAIQRALWKACASVARDTVSRGERLPATSDVSAFVQQMAVISSYWSVMEARFHEMLASYTLDRDIDDIRREWLEAAAGALESAWNQYRESVATGDVWTIRALARGERPLALQRMELRENIKALTTEAGIA